MKTIKVIDLGDRVIFADTIIGTYRQEGYNNLFSYYVSTTNGNYSIRKDNYDKINEYLLSFNEPLPKEDKKIEKIGAFNIKKFYDDYPETANFILAMFYKQEELIEKVNGEDNE